jgi:hypothetical protein
MDDDRHPDAISRLLGDFVREVADTVATPPWVADPRRPGRGRPVPGGRGWRVLVLAMSTAVVAAVVGLVFAYGPRSSDGGHGVITHPGGHRSHPSVRSIDYGGSFHPAEIVGASGALWVTGSRGGDPLTGPCAVERIDPAQLAPVAYALSACGMNIVAGQDHLYLETVEDSPDNGHAIRIESVSTADETSTVFGPVVMTVVGSEIAHTQLGYADGWLWLYGYTDGPEVVQISPTTGAVVRTVTDVPGIGGTEPIIAAGPGGIWLAGGPGGPGGPAFILSSPTAGGVIREFPAAPPSRTVEWLAAEAGRMWIGEADAPVGPHPSPTEHIVVVNRSGDVLQRSPVEDYGSAPVTVAGQLWTVGPGGTGCATQPIWRVDRASLRTSVITTLAPPSDPCLTPSFRSVTTAGGALFVLDGAGGSAAEVLYRVTP